MNDIAGRVAGAARRRRIETCCPESLALTRRGLLRGLLAGGVATTVGSAVVSTAPAYGAPAPAVLVVLSLRGAADGLSLVVPHGDPAYYAARPRIGVPRDALLAPDAFFGLHPSLAPLLPMWQAGEVAAIHATGMRVANRSHFAAMELVEDAAPGSSTRTGWLNRLVGASGSTDPLAGLAVGDLPTALVGEETVMSIKDLSVASLPGSSAGSTARRDSLAAMWATEEGPLAAGMRAAMASVDRLAAAEAQPAGTGYPANSDLGRALSSVARTLRADLGVNVVTVDHGAWDMHTNLGTLSWGDMVSNTRELGQAIAAFFTDLGAVRSKVTLVTISEFGRRVAENSSYGLDHGWGNVMLVAGAGVKGGYYARWTALQNTLDADLAVTTDYRDVLAEVVTARMGTSLAAVFPGLSRTPIGFMTGQSGWGSTTTTVPDPPAPTPTTPPPAPQPPPPPSPVPVKPQPKRRRRRRRKRRRRRMIRRRR
ncbi:MAG TPA: DUF1501 domain-containing protein [Nocardioides sp.]|uniref:DUF1501 domain-containing protein n=1 Tax=Nocardioides sp. TaxID=35761 RepID=UPI002EDB99A9